MSFILYLKHSTVYRKHARPFRLERKRLVKLLEHLDITDQWSQGRLVESTSRSYTPVTQFLYMYVYRFLALIIDVFLPTPNRTNNRLPTGRPLRIPHNTIPNTWTCSWQGVSKDLFSSLVPLPVHATFIRSIREHA